MKVLAIDQGTTGSKAFTLDEAGHFAKVAGFEHAQHYPQAGWVEHDAEELLAHVTACIAAAGPVDAIGIDNQGETLVAWDAGTGKPIHRAIVWQDDRTKDVTERLKAEGAEDLTLARAGLPLDPYFSASKMRWIIDHVDGAKALLQQGRLRIATSDAFFLDRLTGEYATDVTTASRTSLMSLDTLAWDDDLLKLFGVPREVLPEIRDTTGPFGVHERLPVTASLVDQQAALFGHGCARAGDAKITFGTGAFALGIAGAARPPRNASGLAATVAWRVGGKGADFALDGAVYNAASAINWGRGIGLFSQYDEINSFDRPSALSRGLCFVPALSGLACPHWDRNAAGLWIGLGLDTTKADMMQAMLEGIALRAAEVMQAMAGMLPLAATISIDGGLANNPYFAGFLANALNRTVTVASSTELTALGTARMAMRGLGAGDLPPLPSPQRIHRPDHPLTDDLRGRFAEAVTRARNWRS
ncbi:FGGY family carbohydrate kinase [Aestuariivirga sp.]|uniref:FGGY family carbohydrate kinase n=1 Tax=Aestuariivirga sp. TaxID=2650926 RepID=UPI0039E45F04